jgi:Raf kinase inhibitor-like YbhB/YbcL family protein
MRKLLFFGIGVVLGWGLSISSPQWPDGGEVQLEQVYYQCGGENVSPEVDWKGLPEGTKGVAIVIWDPDAPKKGGWYHWVVTDLPPNLGRLPKGAGASTSPYFRKGTQFKNDYGELGYGGPCPPPGETHHYELRVYALSKKLNLFPTTPLPEVIKEIEKYKIGEARIVALYRRQ